MDELYEAIGQLMKENHVDAFTDLTDQERALLMDRAIKLMHPGELNLIVKELQSLKRRGSLSVYCRTVYTLI